MATEKLAILGGKPVIEKQDEALFHWPIVNDAMREAPTGRSGRRKRKRAEMLLLALCLASITLGASAGAPLPDASGFGGAKVTKTAEGVDVESAVGAPWSGVSLNFAKPGVEIAWNAATGKIQPKEM